MIPGFTARTTRRNFRGGVFAAAVCGILISQVPVAHAQPAARPNIVVIMTDDLDLPSLKAALAGGLMPNLRSYFFSRGVSFTESFSVGALGAPSRATFLTGRYPHNHGVLNNFGPTGGILRLDQSSTVATWLKAAGYRTALSGRHVTGYGWWSPESEVPPGWDEWYGLIDPSTLNLMDYRMNVNGSVVDFGFYSWMLGVELYQTDVVAYFASDFIKRAAPQAASQPFFLLVTPTVFNLEQPAVNECPGGGFLSGSVWGADERPASRYLNSVFMKPGFTLPLPPSLSEPDVSDKPAWVQANPMLTQDDLVCLQKRYWRKLEVLRSLDDLVGTVMGALQSSAVFQNTVVMFTSDNGFMDGQHRFPNKTPAYEESIRVPLVVLTPGNTVFKTISSMVLNTDLAPTIAELAHATPTYQPDGRSWLPLLSNPSAPWRKMAFFEHVPDDDFSVTLGITGPPSYQGIRTLLPGAHMFVEYPGAPGIAGEYYDLVADPYELNSLYATDGAQADLQYLRQWVDAMKTCSGLTCLIYEHYFQPPAPAAR